jgi:hypothetical protein
MIYREPGFLAVVCRMIRLLAHYLPPPLSRQQLVSFLSLPVCRLLSLLTGEGGGGGGGAKSYDVKSGPLKIIQYSAFTPPPPLQVQCRL